MNLNNLQTDFCQAVISGEKTDVGCLIHAGDFNAERRLQVYRNNIKATLTESLSAVFSVTEAIVGKEYFKFLASKYIAKYPPDNGTIHGFGNQLAEFIQTMDELQSFLYLSDVARIDWACHQAYHARSETPVTIDCLAKFTPDDYENLQFRQHPSVTVLASKYPVFEIWSYGAADSENTPAPDINTDGQNVLVVREELNVNVVNIELELFLMLEMSKQNCNLGSIMTDIIGANSEYNLQSGLYQLFSTGAITDVTATKP